MAIRRFLYRDSNGRPKDAQANEELAAGKITITPVGGVSLDGGGGEATNYSNPTAPQSLVTKAYADALASGIRDFKDSVRAKTTGNVDLGAAPDTVDGVALAANDRVLVASQTDPSENGIYTVTALGTGSDGVWTRATDADSDPEVTPGLFVFVEEGSPSNADTGWILSTNSPITLDTTPLTFVQFSALASLSAGAGLVKSGNQVDVELATDPGLEFDAVGVTGKLRAKVDTARGLVRDSSGIGVALATDPGLQFTGGALDAKIDANGGLQKGAAGLAVKPDATADNVATTSAGLKVTKAPVVARKWLTSEAVGLGKVAYISGNDTVGVAQSTDQAKANAVVGVSIQAIGSGVEGFIVEKGPAPGVLSSATAGTEYFLGSTGSLVLQGGVGAGERLMRMGVAINATDLHVEIFDLGEKATS